MIGNITMEKQEIQEQLNSIWKGWELKELIGEGSYGKVYKIERDEFGHVYQSALKVITIPQSSAEYKSVINDGMDEASAKEYFYSIVKDIVEEFTLMSRLKGNTNIVSYEDHAVIEIPDGIGWNIFIRMELLTPVLDYYRKSTLSIRNIVKLGIDMCSALEICGQYNIIHRDVKPENIFISELGSYKLGDFGIAKQLEKTSGSLSRKGTINYMAPEVYKGEKYDQTVDIYSLGLVLYRFLNNNRMPFVPPHPQPILYADKEEANIKRMKGLEMDPPCNALGKLADVVIKACSFDPENRYKSPSDMKRDLISLLNDGDEREDAYSDNDGIHKIDVNYYSRKAAENETVTYKSTELPIVEKSDYGVRKDDSNPIDDPIPVSSDPMIVSTDTGSGKKWIPVVLTIIVLMAAGILVYFFYNNSRKSTVPYITGMTVDEANALVTQDEYELVVQQTGEDYSDSIEKGDIISQNILEGTSVDKGTVIEVIVSRGARISIPDLVGHETREAEDIAVSAGLNYNVSEEVYSDDVEAGIVMTQDLEAGTDADEGQTIYVTVSKGKELIAVPNVTGMNSDEAIAVLADLMLTYEISEEYSNDVEAGNIISQDIAEGNMVEKNTMVKLVKSIGPEPKPKTTTTTAPRSTGSNSSGKSSKSSKSNKSSGEVIWEDVK